MEVVINDIPLSQAQLDAIVPVLNEAMQKRMSKKVLEAKCIEAMANAGCPLVAHGNGVDPLPKARSQI